MAKKDKAPEQNSAPAVTSDTDITTEGQHIKPPEAPPFEVDALPPDMGEVVIPAEITEQLIAEKNGGKIAAAKEAEAAAAVIDFPQQEPPEDTRQEWEKPLAEIEAEQQPKRRGRPPKEDKATSGQVGAVDKVAPRPQSVVK